TVLVEHLPADDAGIVFVFGRLKQTFEPTCLRNHTRFQESEIFAPRSGQRAIARGPVALIGFASENSDIPAQRLQNGIDGVLRGTVHYQDFVKLWSRARRNPTERSQKRLGRALIDWENDRAWNTNPLPRHQWRSWRLGSGDHRFPHRIDDPIHSAMILISKIMTEISLHIGGHGWRQSLR